MPFQLVTSPFFSFDREANGTAGERRWGASCCPGAAVRSLPSREAAVSECHAANPAFANRALGVLSQFFTRQLCRQEIKVYRWPQYVVMFLSETEDQKVIAGEAFVRE